MVQARKKSFSITVPYNGNLELEDVSALLMPSSISGTGSFAPNAITLVSAKPLSKIVLDFPSLTTLQFDGLKTTEAAKLKQPGGWTVCVATGDAGTNSCVAAVVPANVYMRALSTGYAKTPAADAPDFSMTASIQSVRQAADNTVTFSLNIEPPKGAPVKISASGGELLVGGNPVGEISVTAKGNQTVTLRNTMAGGMVVIHGESASPDDATAKTAKDLSIAIQAASAAPSKS